MLEILENVFMIAVRYGILLFETLGVIILLIKAVKALYFLFTNGGKKSRLELAEGISLALSFLLGSEVLKTVVAPDWSDIGMTCAVLLMRAGMAVLIHWERKHEQ